MNTSTIVHTSTCKSPTKRANHAQVHVHVFMSDAEIISIQKNKERQEILYTILLKAYNVNQFCRKKTREDL